MRASVASGGVGSDVASFTGPRKRSTTLGVAWRWKQRLAWVTMKLSRLLQPRNPLFWLMLALNALSAALAWIVQNRPLNAWAIFLVTGFAIGNAVMGTWLAWRLLRDEPGADDSGPTLR